LDELQEQVATAAPTPSQTPAFVSKANQLSSRLGQSLKPEHRSKLIWGYRGAAALVVIAVLCPWATSSGASSMVGGWQNASYSASISGTETTWGVLALLVAAAGGVLSLLSPARFLKDKTKLTMAAVGVVVLVLAITIWIKWSSNMSGGHDYSDTYGNYSKHSEGMAFGFYLTLLGGAVLGALGFLNDWEK
jgi:uncharacterized membrane protein